jgi:hypothetical protein
MTLAVEPSAPAIATPQGRRLSRTLRDIHGENAPSLAVHEITGRMGETAFGALIALFALPCLIPAPPGISQLLALPLLLISGQAALGASSPWLPGVIRHRRISQSRLGQLLGRALPALDRIEAHSRPRWTFLFNPPAERFIGLVCALLALSSMVPIPFAHMVPAVAAGLFGLSLMQRDGVLLLLAAGLSGLSGAILALGAGAVAALVNHFAPMLLGVV